MNGWSQRARSTGVVVVAVVGAALWSGSAQAQVAAGQWRFDEGSGTIAHDSSGSGLNGTMSGGPDGVGPTWIAGVSGSALHFDGDDVVALPDTTKLEPQRITVAAWVRRAGSPGDYRYVVSKGSRACYTSSYGLYTGPQGSAAFYVSDDSVYTVSPQPSLDRVWDGRWHRLVGTYDRSYVRLYIDGRRVGHGTPATSGIAYGMSSKSPYIGSYRGGCDLPFSGDIDTVDIYGRALSDADIAADAGLLAPPPSLPGSGGGQIPAAPAPASPTVRAGCLWFRARPGSVRARRHTRIVAKVRVNGRARAHVRLRLRARKLKATAVTGRRGIASFRVRPARGERRLTLRARSTAALGCTRTAKIIIHVRR